MANVIWTDEALNWLQEIYDYISVDSPTAAERVLRGIVDKAKTLARFPQQGYIHGLIRGVEVRVSLYGQYRIAYSIETPEAVTIFGVFHAALDIDRILGN